MGVVLPWRHSYCGPLSSDKVGAPHSATTAGSRKGTSISQGAFLTRKQKKERKVGHFMGRSYQHVGEDDFD